MHIQFGGFDDYPEGEVGMTMYMRESIYQKLVRGEYKVSPDSKFWRKLILVDNEGCGVPALSGCIY